MKTYHFTELNRFYEEPLRNLPASDTAAAEELLAHGYLTYTGNGVYLITTLGINACEAYIRELNRESLPGDLGGRRR